MALATDYNPGSSPTDEHTFRVVAGLHPHEDDTGGGDFRRHHQWRLGPANGDRKGSIEPGKDADLAIFDVADYREIAYWFGVNRCDMTIAGGVVLE